MKNRGGFFVCFFNLGLTDMMQNCSKNRTTLDNIAIL